MFSDLMLSSIGNPIISYSPVLSGYPYQYEFNIMDIVSDDNGGVYIEAKISLLSY